MSGVRWHVVKCEWVGGVDNFSTERYWQHDHPTLSGAKRAGLREFGHDDFNIAKVRNGVLLAWTWMGEVIDETPESLAEIAESLDWAVSPGSSR